MKQKLKWVLILLVPVFLYFSYEFVYWGWIQVTDSNHYDYRKYYRKWSDGFFAKQAVENIAKLEWEETQDRIGNRSGFHSREYTYLRRYVDDLIEYKGFDQTPEGKVAIARLAKLDLEEKKWKEWRKIGSCIYYKEPWLCHIEGAESDHPKAVVKRKRYEECFNRYFAEVPNGYNKERALKALKKYKSEKEKRNLNTPCLEFAAANGILSVDQLPPPKPGRAHAYGYVSTSEPRKNLTTQIPIYLHPVPATNCSPNALVGKDGKWVAPNISPGKYLLTNYCTVGINESHHRLYYESDLVTVKESEITDFGWHRAVRYTTFHPPILQQVLSPVDPKELEEASQRKEWSGKIQRFEFKSRPHNFNIELAKKISVESICIVSFANSWETDEYQTRAQAIVDNPKKWLPGWKDKSSKPPIVALIEAKPVSEIFATQNNVIWIFAGGKLHEISYELDQFTTILQEALEKELYIKKNNK